IRKAQYATFAIQPNVNSKAQTVFPADVSATPRDSAALIKDLPKAMPTFGRHDSSPASTAIRRPLRSTFAEPAPAALGAFLDAATEHETIPPTTTKVPASTMSLFGADRV